MRAAAVLAVATLAALAAGTVAVSQEPAESGEACVRVTLAVVVDLGDVRHAHLIHHVHQAVNAGQPRVLHIERDGAAARRSAALRGIPTLEGFDRDEYPPAVAEEGGEGASVVYVDSSENRSGGAVMSRQLRPFCDGQAFIMEP